MRQNLFLLLSTIIMMIIIIVIVFVFFFNQLQYKISANPFDIKQSKTSHNYKK